MKYIDAEKLYKQVDEKMGHFAELEEETRPDDEDLSIFYQGKKKMCSELLGIICSLQQEQPEVDLGKEIEKYYYENFAFISSEHIPTKDILSGIAVHFYELGLNARSK